MNVGEISPTWNASSESSTKLSKIQGAYFQDKFRLSLNSHIDFGETQRYISYISYVNMIIKQMLSQTFRKLKIALNGEI